MLTRWGKALDKTAVLDDYPRPHLVRDGWQNLNGTWEYAIASRYDAQPITWDGEILVPFSVESELSGVACSVEPDECLWYRRDFSVADANDRTLLHFGAVDHECVLWVNDALVGSHRGGFDTFSFDISGYLRGGNNSIVVRVTDPSSSDDQPRGKQHLTPQGIWYTPVTGIWQTVWLESVPRENHIEELVFDPNELCDGVQFTGFLARPTRDPELALRLVIRLGDEVVSQATARPDRKVTVPLVEPARWSPSTPTLYSVEVKLLRITNPLPADNERQGTAQLLRRVPLRGETESTLYAAADVDKAEEIDRVTGYFALRRVEVGSHPTQGAPDPAAER